jgi:hypothetical protein
MVSSDSPSSGGTSAKKTLSGRERTTHLKEARRPSSAAYGLSVTRIKPRPRAARAHAAPHLLGDREPARLEPTC